jgi:hypothetical protein
MILHRVKKNKSSYVFHQVKHIVIDDMHLQSKENYSYLEHLAAYKSVFYVSDKLAGNFGSLKKS